jgi:hypothetical protein
LDLRAADTSAANTIGLTATAAPGRVASRVTSLSGSKRLHADSTNPNQRNARSNTAATRAEVTARSHAALGAGAAAMWSAAATAASNAAVLPVAPLMTSTVACWCRTTREVL